MRQVVLAFINSNEMCNETLDSQIISNTMQTGHKALENCCFICFDIICSVHYSYTQFHSPTSAEYVQDLDS
jgi:hypothetical protein